MTNDENTVAYLVEILDRIERGLYDRSGGRLDVVWDALDDYMNWKAQGRPSMPKP